MSGDIAMRAAPRRRGRSAHPYDDIDVIDARAPRFNQATVGVVSALALVSGWWPLFGLLALQLIVGLTFGRRFCLPCVFYFEVLQPRLGEGEIEDSRPPRFANIVGAVFLSAATGAHVVGLSIVGAVLGGIVAVLALLAAITGLCVGCEMYRLIARLRGIGSRGADRFDPADLDVEADGEVVVQFTHPLCTDCHALTRKLSDQGRDLVLIDVSKNPELARKYGVSLVPAAFEVAPDGRVAERLA